VQFRVQDVNALVDDALSATKLPADALELEVTETTLMRAPARAAPWAAIPGLGRWEGA